MKPTQRDLETIDAIKRRLEDSKTQQNEKEDLLEKWMAIGMDYMEGLLDDVDSFPNRQGGSILVSSVEILADTALTTVGICQAETFAKSFIQAPDLIAVSSCACSKQTAEALSSRCRGVPVETWDVGEFVFMDPETHRLESEHQRREAVSHYWRGGDAEWKDGVGSESLVEFIRRVDSALRRLQEKLDIWTIVFTHYLFVTAARLCQVEPGVPVDASFFAKLRDAQNLANPSGYCIGGLEFIALKSF